MSDRISPRRQAQFDARALARAVHPVLTDAARAETFGTIARVLPGRQGESARRAAVCYSEAATTTDGDVATALRLVGARNASLVLSPR